MRVCPSCNTPYPDIANNCARDGTPLVTMKNVLEERRVETHADHTGQVFGNYRLNRQLGVGGMGAVYHATHVAISKEVAVKVLREDQAQDEALLERFLREARAVAKNLD